MKPQAPATRAQVGMTVLEIMIGSPVIGGLFFIARTGFRTITKADLSRTPPS